MIYVGKYHFREYLRIGKQQEYPANETTGMLSTWKSLGMPILRNTQELRSQGIPSNWESLKNVHLIECQRTKNSRNSQQLESPGMNNNWTLQESTITGIHRNAQLLKSPFSHSNWHPPRLHSNTNPQESIVTDIPRNVQ